MPKASRVAESSTSTSSATITLSGAVTGRRTVASKHSVGETGIELVIEDAAGNWLEGVYTFTSAGPTVMTRTAILASSNNDADVTFPAGAKTVSETASGTFLNQISPNYIPFSTVVPFLNSGGTYMPDNYPVTGPLTFTPGANAVRGAYAFVFLKANGANVPDVSAFTEHGSSMGYLNTANILNIANFFYLGGVPWVSWSQAAVPVAITTPTTVTMTGPTSGVINTASSNYTVGTDGTRSSAVVVTPTPVTGVTFTPSSVTLPAGTATATFTATSTTTGAKTIAVTNNGGLANPSNITLTVAAAATAPGAPTIGTATAGDTTASFPFTAPASDGGSAITGYTLTVYKVSDNSVVGTFGASASPALATGLANTVAVYGKVAAINVVNTGAQSAASNSVTPAAAATLDRFGSLVNVTETGSGPYSYVGGAAGVWDNAQGGIYQKKFANGVDGTIKIRVDAYNAGAGNFVMIGLTTSATPVAFPSLTAYFYTNSSSGIYSGSVGTKVNDVVPASGDIMYMRRVGTTLYLDVSKDGGTTFTTAWQLTLANTAFNIQVIPNKSGAWTTVSSTGLV
jgi:hypothetical protein